MTATTPGRPPYIHADLTFDQVGLIAERRLDGSKVCNLFIIGGPAGLPVPPDWGRLSVNGFLLALTLLLHVLHRPHYRKGPLQPLLTQHYMHLPKGTQILDDGTRVTPWEGHLAKKFSARYIEGHEDPDTLTMDLPTIVQRYAELVHENWPDAQ